MKRLLLWSIALLALLAGRLVGSRAPQVQGEDLDAPIRRAVVKHPWLAATALGTCLVIFGLLIVVSGIVPIKASSGHWTITAWFLDFTKRRSVATHSWGIERPSLDSPALVTRGAGHYESGCRPCHGGPDADTPKVMAAMTPNPPLLSRQVRRWKPEELFSIVKHGIKFTGMPAWAAKQRDDEVWAVVAFLLKLPDIDARDYRRLVYGDVTAAANPLSNHQSATSRDMPRAVRDSCGRCHGVDGRGRGHSAFPSLAGQRAPYLYASLRAFVDGSRFSGIMGPIAQTLSDGSMREVSQYYGNLPARPADPASDLSAVARGQAIAARGIPEQDMPSCADCHGPAETPKNPAYPRLAGQYTEYLALQLNLFKQRRRGGSPYAGLMHTFVDRLGEEQITSVAVYYSSLPAAADNSR